MLAGALALSCTREPSPEHDSSEAGFKTIHYKVQVSSSGVSKATTAENDTKYVFQATDSLYVSSTDPDSGDVQLFGVLTLMYGSGETTAYFEGNLVGVNEFEPDSDTPINVTLVSSEDRIHTTSEGQLTDTSYPANEYCTTLAEAVQKYSHFTCSTTFGATSFTLSQNSSFVICKIKMPAADLPDATSVTASLESGGNTVWEGNVTSTVNGNGLVGKLDFVIPFEGGNVTLSSASLSLEWEDALDAPQSKDFELSSKTLAANNYYTVERSTIYFDGFHIKGTVNNTEITFNYNYADDGIEYSFDEGISWTEYTSPFTLNAGEEVCVRGDRANYANNGGDQYGTPGNSPIFTATNKVYIYGNIMSLLHDKNTLVASAFHGAFSKGANNALTNIDIDPDKDLILPSTTLPTSCYQQMFRNCTSLTKAPVFRAEVVNYRCCYNMFRQCSNLVDVSGIELPATTLAIDCYRELFRLCEKLATIAQDLLPATTLVQGCYQQMFQNTKIVTAPDLPAPTLVKDCYSEMFRNCSALQNVTCLATTNIGANNSLNNWMNNVKSGGTFTRLQSVAELWPSGVSGIPSDWGQQDY